MILKQVQHILVFAYVCWMLLALILIGVYETGILLPGDLSEVSLLQFWCQIGMELLTICSIPLALRLFKFHFVVSSIRSGREKKLLLWALLRIDMLGCPLMLNVLLYELTLNPAFGYMGIILFLCMFFITPSMERCKAELG